MVKLKNYNVAVKYFVLFLTFTASVSCGPKKIYVSRIEGQEIGITDKNAEDQKIADFIKPYKESIDKDLNTVLAYASQTLDKNGQWQSPMGNLFADTVMDKGNPVFERRENKSLDIVLLNHGGIRSIIPKGDVTTRTAFEIMPFENSLVVIAMKGDAIMDMLRYIITEKKPHPLTGMTFTIAKNNEPTAIMIQGKPLELEKIYYVGTNDYLSNGGDNMVFFKKGTAKYDLDYKLRNILIDYFKEVDTVPMINDTRISVEK